MASIEKFINNIFEMDIIVLSGKLQILIEYVNHRDASINLSCQTSGDWSNMSIVNRFA